MVPEMADFLLRADCAQWAAVAGVYKDTLYVSMRTIDEEADAGAAMVKLLPPNASGGGHPSMAGGQIPLVGLEKEARREVARAFLQSFVDYLAPDAEGSEPLILPEE
jgi:nanoRNase/pAp phosphatase (c-di-AMP/oligoRNAs hydrolase)